MIRRQILLAAAIGSVAAGCAMDPERQAALDRAQCREYGMRPGTDAFANCRMTLDVERKRDRSRRLDGGFDRGFYPPLYGRW